ncbi:MAG TPA: hypothetical protein VGL77_07020, partial [Armatimonadota bacterium]
RSKPTLATLRKLQRGFDKLKREQEEQTARIDSIIAAVKGRCQSVSVRQFARLAEIDQGNLTRLLTRKRKPSQQELKKLESALLTAVMEGDTSGNSVEHQ